MVKLREKAFLLMPAGLRSRSHPLVCILRSVILIFTRASLSSSATTDIAPRQERTICQRAEPVHRPPHVIRGPTRCGRVPEPRSCNSSSWPRDLLWHNRGCSVRIPVTRPYGCHECLVRSSFSSRDWLSNPTLVLKQEIGRAHV